MKFPVVGGLGGLMGIIVLSLGWAAGQQPCDCPQGYKCKEAGSATPATPFAPSGETFVETSCFDKILTQFMIDNDIPGGAVAVMKDGEIVYEQGYGTRDAPGVGDDTTLMRPALSNTPFRQASLSKPVTALAIMALVERGDLGLHDTPFSWDGGLLGHTYGTPIDDRVNQITIRQLLRHTGGWDRDVGGDTMFQYGAAAAANGGGIEVGANARLVNCNDFISYAVRNLYLDNNPGETYAYSNLGYCILGRVIEMVVGGPDSVFDDGSMSYSGISYEEAVRNLIMDPAGIPRSEFYMGSSLLSEIPDAEAEYTCTDLTGNIGCDTDVTPTSVFPGEPFAPAPYGRWSMNTMDAHGGWVASPRAMLKLMKAFWEPHCGSGAASGCLLSAANMAEVKDISHGSGNYGFGFVGNEYGNYWHTGSLPGTASLLVLSNTGLAWNLVFNKEAGSGGYNGDFDSMMWSATGCVSDWPSSYTYNLNSLEESVDYPPRSFLGWSEKTRTQTPTQFTRAGEGTGWCVDQYGDEGRNRRIGYVQIAAACEGACEGDELCVGYASNPVDGDCVIYTDEMRDEVHPGFNWIEGGAAEEFEIVGSANCGADCWDQAVCRVPSWGRRVEEGEREREGGGWEGLRRKLFGEFVPEYCEEILE
ncbi:hypothetical protein TrVE_jg9023 [Triparma verrucosa]|uniref:Beta-lactamase-related domain-containing protein n=1 Tax=Triparma verrucosa TaxID=1606542 RepID=A0A9W7CAS6_9STRA|nr:hypothetical protein TrVE_jg9023 [Triparma verrucosa]